MSTAASGGGPVIRAFTRADLRPAVEVLARAFTDDPLLAWIFPDPRERQRRLPPFFTSTLRGISLHQPGTEVAVGGGRVQGCAIWMAPGAWRPPLRRQLAALPSTIVRLGRRLPVASAAYGALMAVHPERPHWYLSGIGTDPVVQGQGIGSALLRSQLVRCDAAGQAAYLESSRDINVPFYQRHGFAVTAELTLPCGGPVLWLMWREPQQAGRDWPGR